MTSENIHDVLASVEQHRDELEEAIREAVRLLQRALDEDAPRKPAPVWKPVHAPKQNTQPHDA